MSVFLVRYSVSQDNRSRDFLHNNIEKFYSFLPKPPSNIISHDCGHNELVVFQFDAALDRKPVIYDSGDIVLCQGYGNSYLEDRVRHIFISNKSFNIDSCPEAFCAIRITKQSIEFGSSLVGIDPIFYYEDDEQLVITNRHNLLGYWLEKPTIRKKSLAWMIGRNHIGDFGTYWNEIKKCRPGVVYKKHSTQPMYEIDIDYSSMYESIDNSDISPYIDNISNTFNDVMNSGKYPLNFWLSGGKDSRAIAGLLSNSDKFSEIEFSTFGETFQPDVMSATQVAIELGVLDNYKTYKSSMEEPTVDIIRSIARDLCTDFSGSSLADFRSVAFTGALIIGGHENGFKIPANTKNLEQYIESRKYWADGLGLLSLDSYNELNEWYSNELRNVLANIPMSRYAQMDAIIFRNGTYLSGSQAASHISRSEIHPFLDGRMLKLLLGVSDQALDAQLIHYIMMRKSNRILENIPFANDVWPQKTEELSSSIGLPFRRTPQIPYKFQSYFPSSKVFGGYSWRLQLIDQSKSFVTEYLNDNKCFFDFINYNVLNDFLRQESSSLYITPIYHYLSLLKICLIHAFHKDGSLFKFSLEKDMEIRLSGLLTELAKPMKGNTDLLLKYQKKIDDYELAIANVAEKDRNIEKQNMKMVSAKIAGKLYQSLPLNKEHFLGEIYKLGFKELMKEGLFLTKLTEVSNLEIDGSLLIPEGEVNKVLIAIKNMDDSSMIEGFIYSEMGFLFKYLNSSLDNPQVHIKISNAPKDAEIWLIPWYPSSPVLFSDFHISTRNIK